MLTIETINNELKAQGIDAVLVQSEFGIHKCFFFQGEAVEGLVYEQGLYDVRGIDELTLPEWVQACRDSMVPETDRS